MHALGKDENDYLAFGDWCSPPDLFDSGTYSLLKDKCLVEHPNCCGDRFFHEGIFFFVTYWFLTTFIISNVLIAVILEGYEEGTTNKQKEVIDDCLQVWKQFDPNYTEFLNMCDACMFIEEVLKRQSKDSGVDLIQEGFFGSDAKKCVSKEDLAEIPMQYAKTLEDLQVNDAGEINFLHAVKLVIRLVFAQNDPDLQQELEEAELKLQQKDPRALEKLKRHQEKHTERSGVRPGSLRAQVAASKIQRLFKARQERKKKARERKTRLEGLERENENEGKQGNHGDEPAGPPVKLLPNTPIPPPRIEAARLSPEGEEAVLPAAPEALIAPPGDEEEMAAGKIPSPAEEAEADDTSEEVIVPRVAG